MRAHRSIVLLASLSALALSACGSNIWRANFEGAPVGFYEETERVDVREVPWSRVESTLSSIETSRAGSDTHWKDWSHDELMAEQRRLLTGLQISEDPENIVVLGRSVFRSTSSVSPYGPELASFARELGADYAVWSSNYLGKADTIVREPVTRDTVQHRYYTDSSGRTRSEFVPWSETIFVPIVIEADEYAWVVYYLRRK